jgi:hypothetical protein
VCGNAGPSKVDDPKPWARRRRLQNEGSYAQLTGCVPAGARFPAVHGGVASRNGGVAGNGGGDELRRGGLARFVRVESGRAEWSLGGMAYGCYFFFTVRCKVATQLHAVAVAGV